MLPSQDERIKETLRKVRRLEILMKGKVREAVGGEYASRFKGQGLDFDEFREYQPGDEIRFIDWNVTARSGIPHIKKFTEQRELNVVIAVDISASMDFSTTTTTKRDMAAELAAAFAFSAISHHDRAGLVLFGTEVEFFLPSKRGYAHALRILREILYRSGKPGLTNYHYPLDLLTARLPHRCLCVIISDFLSGDLQPALGSAGAKHDILACQILDPAEINPPAAGNLSFQDPESQRIARLPTSRKTFQDTYRLRFNQRASYLEKTFRTTRTDFLRFRTDADPMPSLHAFLKKRPAPQPW